MQQQQEKIEEAFCASLDTLIDSFQLMGMPPGRIIAILYNVSITESLERLNAIPCLLRQESSSGS